MAATAASSITVPEDALNREIRGSDELSRGGPAFFLAPPPIILFGGRERRWRRSGSPRGEGPREQGKTPARCRAELRHVAASTAPQGQRGGGKGAAPLLRRSHRCQRDQSPRVPAPVQLADRRRPVADAARHRVCGRRWSNASNYHAWPRKLFAPRGRTTSPCSRGRAAAAPSRPPSSCLPTARSVGGNLPQAYFSPGQTGIRKSRLLACDTP